MYSNIWYYHRLFEESRWNLEVARQLNFAYSGLWYISNYIIG